MFGALMMGGRSCIVQPPHQPLAWRGLVKTVVAQALAGDEISKSVRHWPSRVRAISRSSPYHGASRRQRHWPGRQTGEAVVIDRQFSVRTLLWQGGHVTPCPPRSTKQPRRSGLEQRRPFISVEP